MDRKVVSRRRVPALFSVQKRVKSVSGCQTANLHNVAVRSPYEG